MSTILFIHGLGGCPNTRTAQLIRKYLPDDFVFAPEIPYDPTEAAEFIWDLHMTMHIDLVIGVSLGAFYAMKLGGVKKLLINPAMMPDIDIKERIGIGTKVPVAVGHRVINEDFINTLKEQRQFFYEYCLDSELRKESYAIFGNKDKLFFHKDDYIKYYGNKYIEVNDGHHLSERTIIDVVIPFIQKEVEGINSHEKAKYCIFRR